MTTPTIVRPTATFQIAAGATVSQLIEQGTRLLIDQLQRPVRAVIVDTTQDETDPCVFHATVEAHDVESARGRLETGDVLTRAYRGKAA